MDTIFTQGHACIIGVGSDLPNTINDAQGLADILQDTGRCAYPQEQVHLLTGEKAKRDDILLALDNLATTANSESTVIIYFSGHGYQVASSMGESYYLMPFGYDTKKLYKTAISGAKFTQKLQAIPAKKLLVLLDCCHAGGLDNIEELGLQVEKSPLPPEAQVLFAEGKGRVLIASSMKEEKSYAGKPYSAFTLAIIEAFAGKGVSEKDGYVRVSDLALHAREVVPKRTGGKQHPILNWRESDNFRLAYYAGGELEPKGLPFNEEPEIELEENKDSNVTNKIADHMIQHAERIFNVNQMNNGRIGDDINYHDKVINQTHLGSGDNISGDKNVTTNSYKNSQPVDVSGNNNQLNFSQFGDVNCNE